MEIAVSQNQLFSPVVVGSGSLVNSDQDAVRAFLRQLETSPLATERAYKKEIRRFLAWLLYVGHAPGDALRTLTVVDIENYFRFLRSPAPLPKAAADGVGLWKGATSLAPASITHAKTLLANFFDKLQDYEIAPGQAFRSTNPVRAMGNAVAARRDPRAPGEKVPVRDEASSRCLEPEDIALLRETLEASPRDTPEQQIHYARQRWVLAIAYYGWLRLSEMARLQMGDFELSKEGIWQLYVYPSKREKHGVKIDAFPALMDELVAYRTACGKLPYPMAADRHPAIYPMGRRLGPEQVRETPIRNLRGETVSMRRELLPRIPRQLSDKSIFVILKGLFQAAAERAQAPGQRIRLQEASPHWLRHSGITHALNAGMDPRYVARQARHKDLKTTFAVYDHGLTADRRLSEAHRMPVIALGAR